MRTRTAARIAFGALVAALIGPASIAEAQRGAPPFTSPEVGADRTVTLRLFAPNAKSIVANGELDGKPHPLTRAENGYLLHGAGDLESGWTMIGRANNILDNAIAESRAKPMIVVMPLGHAMQSFWTGPSKQVTDPVTAAFAGATLDDIIAAMMAATGKAVCRWSRRTSSKTCCR
jgi:hypothetical protein